MTKRIALLSMLILLVGLFLSLAFARRRSQRTAMTR
jgi:hypothetical protein